MTTAFHPSWPDPKKPGLPPYPHVSQSHTLRDRFEVFSAYWDAEAKTWPNAPIDPEEVGMAQ